MKTIAQKKSPAQLGTGRTFWQVGQESNLQPAVLELAARRSYLFACVRQTVQQALLSPFHVR